MTTNAVLPLVISQQDEEVFNMEFAELDDFLGDMEFQPIYMSPELYSSSISNEAATVSPVSPEIPERTNTINVYGMPFSPAPTYPSSLDEPTARISPASSVAGGDSSGDDSSVSHIPAEVTTSSSAVQSAHIKNQYAATNKGSTSPVEVAQLKKNRRRERNREHAKKCRSRKKNYLKCLEESVVDLKQENEKMRRLMMMKFSKEEITAMMKEQIDAAAATGVAVLAKPNSQSISGTASEFLQRLRDECTTL